MTTQRFRTLAESFGGDISRWPAADRAEAEAFVATHPREATEVLAAERELDARLEAYGTAPSAVLRERILDSAPAARAARPTWRWLAAAGLGLGLAASGAAGVAAGFVFAPPDVARLIGGATPSTDVNALADLAGDAGAG